MDTNGAANNIPFVFSFTRHDGFEEDVALKQVETESNLSILSSRSGRSFLSHSSSLIGLRQHLNEFEFEIRESRNPVRISASSADKLPEDLSKNNDVIPAKLSPINFPDGTSNIAKSENSMDWVIMNWTEDGAGMYVGVIIFCMSIIISFFGSDLTSIYTFQPQWPLGAILIGIGIILSTHYVLGKSIPLASYCTVLMIAVLSKAIGDYQPLINIGLSGSVWAILLGMIFRNTGLTLEKGMFSGEFFVKVGVVLLCMDYSSIAVIGGPGLMVAWGDTAIVIFIGVLIAMQFQFDLRESIVIAGATSICGSSAATAISASIYDKAHKDKVCQGIIAIMGLLNTPLIPLMPMMFTLSIENAQVVGSWIGGSVDSTGQVAAAGRNGGSAVLQTAIIVKMAQNILIGPITLLLTAYFQNTLQLRILIDKFPLFVLGFLLTSMMATGILQSNQINQSPLKDLLISNSWCISEWVTLIGFVCIGLEINVKSIFMGGEQSKILYAYLIIQAVDICTTFGWSYLMFK